MFKKPILQTRLARRALFSKVLVANRGEIACRIIRTCRRLGIRSVAIYSAVDANAKHVRMADEAFCVGPAQSQHSYLNIDRISEIAQQSRAEAVHPGYGFLSENFRLAESLKGVGVEFIGPPVSAIQAMGSKSESKKIMARVKVPVIPGYNGDNQTAEVLESEARRLGFPVLIKAVLGGGGKGMRLVESAQEFGSQLESARSEAMSAFKDDRVILERFITNPRHIEFQVFADKAGNTVHLFERDCSSQRRHQKIVEEAPAPCLGDKMRQEMGATAILVAKAVDYVGAGTVEFILDQDTGRFYFLEMNTRLQVEHPITEMVTGVDLVEWQIRVASGEELPVKQAALVLSGHSIEARIYAEDPVRGFAPDSGTVLSLRHPPAGPDFRFETGIEEGDVVSTFYDPMIAKVVVHADTRDTALSNLQEALSNVQISGLSTNIGFVKALLRHPKIRHGGISSNFVDQNFRQFVPDAVPVEGVCALLCAYLIESALAKTRWSSVGGLVYTQRKVTIDDQRHVVSVQQQQPGPGFVMAIDGKQYSTKTIAASENNVTVQLGDSIVRGTVLPGSATSFTVFVGGSTKHHVAVEKQQASDSALKEFIIKSSIPCRIVALHVKPGDMVKAGQRLLTTEAMKMETTVKSAVDGIVAKVQCRAGQIVTSGQTLVELKPVYG